MSNPFNYLQFATGEHFYDRVQIRQDLRSRILSGQTNVVLYGPRRYGKSSLVVELMADLEREGIPCVSLDLIKVPSIELFVSTYVQKVYRKLAPLKFELHKLGSFLNHLRPKMTLGPDGEVSFSFDAANETLDSEALTDVLNLPQKLVGTERRAVVVLDEFQEVEGLLPDDRFERVMRAVIQSHTNVSYIFLGSRYHLLRRMFTSHNRPFYKSALLVLLDKPPVQESLDFVEERFQKGGQTISRDCAELLVAQAENIPYFIQQLGFETYRLVSDAGRTEVTRTDVETAFQNLAGLNRDQYEQLMLTFSTEQKRLLVALSHEKTRTFDEAYRRRWNLGASSTLNSAKRKLIEDGHLEQMPEGCLVSDPFFAAFLRQA